MNPDNYFKKYIKDGLIYRREGCSNEEIQEIQSFYKYPLPKVYTDFLKIAGREFISYDQIRWGWDNRKFTKKTVEDSIKFSGKKIEVKDSYVFFYINESGTDFGFFELNESENPPVYWYSIIQAENKFCQITNSFTEFIDLLIDEDNLLPKVHTDDLVLYSARDKKVILKLLKFESHEGFNFS